MAQCDIGQCDIGLMGLAVMGQNLALNISDHGYRVAVYNRTTSKVDEFLQAEAKGRDITGTHSLEEFAASLKTPRMILLMIKAGPPVDQTIAALIPLLQAGDILIDGGNSNYLDSMRRQTTLQGKGLRFIGSGISGGEEGARYGPSIMPGGSPDAWPFVQPIFQAIAAKLEDGSPCCEWMGAGGAGHFVKMVHNGIEYAYMQLIAEAYQILRDGLRLTADEMAVIFTNWNHGSLNSFLIEISANILAYKDKDGLPLLDKIVDRSGQKGTGRWTAIAGLEANVPLTVVAEAVFTRSLSALKEERIKTSKIFPNPVKEFSGSVQGLIAELEQALYTAEILTYSQGFMLLHAADQEYNWQMDPASVARIWRNGCIIRSGLLEKIEAALRAQPTLEQLFSSPQFLQEVQAGQSSLRKLISHMVLLGIPLPAFSAALSFFDGYRCARLPANLIQAQRDYFGAHTYERSDAPPGTFFHTDWTGSGGSASSSTYDA